MKEPYIEGLANHNGHESCAGRREATREAYDSGTRRLGIEPRKSSIQVPTRLSTREGNTTKVEIARLLLTWRGRRPQMEDGAKPLTSDMRENSMHGNREILGRTLANGAKVGIGNPKGVSQ